MKVKSARRGFILLCSRPALHKRWPFYLLGGLIIMYEGKSYTLFAKYAVPQMIGLLFNSVYMIVDGVFIGNRLGREIGRASCRERV